MGRCMVPRGMTRGMRGEGVHAEQNAQAMGDALLPLVFHGGWRFLHGGCAGHGGARGRHGAGGGRAGHALAVAWFHAHGPRWAWAAAAACSRERTLFSCFVVGCPSENEIFGGHFSRKVSFFSPLSKIAKFRPHARAAKPRDCHVHSLLLINLGCLVVHFPFLEGGRNLLYLNFISL